MNALTVTIGRNVDSVPLSQEAWNDFRFDVRRAVDQSTSELFVSGAPYKGEWDGVKEDAAIYFGLELSAAGTEVLRQRLAVLATYYHQDTIGLSVGESELVESFDEYLDEPDPFGPAWKLLAARHS